MTDQPTDDQPRPTESARRYMERMMARDALHLSKLEVVAAAAREYVRVNLPFDDSESFFALRNALADLDQP